MLTIVTLFGHSHENMLRLVRELRDVVEDWVILLDREMPPIEG